MFQIDIDSTLQNDLSKLSSYDSHNTWPVAIAPPINTTKPIKESYTVWKAVAANDLEGLKLLLADGCSADERNTVGATPLHLCSSLGHVILASYLINAGADVNALDEESHWTPLHRAIYHSRIGLILLLLEHGARLGVRNEQDCVDNSVVDREGHTPLDLCSLPIRDALRTAASASQGGEMYSFGKTSNFSLGYLTGGKANIQSSPRRIEALLGLPIVSVATSEFHALAITRDGQLFAWGGGRGGRLGLGDEKTRCIPTRVEHALERR